MRCGERVDAGKVVCICFLIYCISVLFQSQKAKMNLDVELGFLLISWGGDYISRSFFSLPMKILLLDSTASCGNNVLHIAGESIHIPETQEAIESSANLKCKKFPWKGGIKKIHATISAMDIPKNLGYSRP